MAVEGSPEQRGGRITTGPTRFTITSSALWGMACTGDWAFPIPRPLDCQQACTRFLAERLRVSYGVVSKDH